MFESVSFLVLFERMYECVSVLSACEHVSAWMGMCECVTASVSEYECVLICV